MRQRNKMFRLIAISCFAFYANMATAQQIKVDSAIMYLNKSFATNKLDSVSFNKGQTMLNGVSLSDSQIAQIESTLKSFKNWENKENLHTVRYRIILSLIKSDIDKGISYGKQQIEQLEKINTPEASSIKGQYLNFLRIPFRNSNRLEDGFQYYTQKLNEYKIKNDSICTAQCYYVLGGFYRISGLLDLAVYNMKKSISFIDTSKNKRFLDNNIGVLGYYYLLKENPDECIKYNRIVNNFYIKNGISYSVISLRMVQAMLMKNRLDSATYFMALAKTDTTDSFPGNRANTLQTEAQFKIQSGAFEEAENLLEECWQLIKNNNIPVNAAAGTIAPDYYYAQLRIKQNRLQEAVDLLTQDISRLLNNRVEILRDYRLIAELYTKMGNGTKAAETYAIFLAKQDSLLAEQGKFRSISFEAEQQMNEKERSIANLESQNRIASLSRNFLIGIAALLLLVVGGIYQRFRFKKKANQLLQNQKEEIELQKKNVEKTLSDLKATQSQLIQSEKMASLGELTAGIAHEIQNPLNFVNNFSEVSNELISELVEEVDMGNTEEVKRIAKDVQQNLEKINHHGKRADAIVKGMLQHSRSSSGVKEPTDINALCDEYLRLAYHGLKAKDNSFEATFHFEPDTTLPKVNVVPQDIGRVLLNLINNAFYAVDEKKKQNMDGYAPTVSVSTKKLGYKVLISVSDNGNGIPSHVVDKIFQPFFTTKPTGQGTGLGLSLSYDIIHSHGGELKVETLPAEAAAQAGKKGEGTTFIINLPVNHA